MSDKPLFPDAIEPERYELSAPPSWLFESDRRSFFKFFGAGLFIICAVSKAVARQESGASRRNTEDSLPQEIDAWLHIGEKGDITVFTGKVEVGQNIRTSLSQGVAEELRDIGDLLELRDRRRVVLHLPLARQRRQGEEQGQEQRDQRQDCGRTLRHSVSSVDTRGPSGPNPTTGRTPPPP